MAFGRGWKYVKDEAGQVKKETISKIKTQEGKGKRHDETIVKQQKEKSIEQKDTTGVEAGA